MQDIPLQTPPGNYNPGWLRKNRIWLLLIAFAAVFAYSCAWVVITVGREGPTTVSIKLVATDTTLVKVSPKTLHHQAGIKDRPSSQEFELKNLSPVPVKVRFALIAQGAGYVPLVNPSKAAENLFPGTYAASARPTDEYYGVKFTLVALDSSLPNSILSANAAARFRLTGVSGVDQKDGERFLILAISLTPDPR